MFKSNLEKYADLVVKVGVNVQKDQEVIINSTVETSDLARLITKKSYEAGARNVFVRYRDDIVNKMKIDMAPEEALEETRKWMIDGLLENHLKKGAAIISIIASDPDLLKDCDPNRVKKSMIAGQKASKAYKDYIMGGNTCWSLVAYPNDKWAKKVFPELSKEDAIDALWDKIFEVTRINSDNPIAEWETHLNTLDEKKNTLNNYKFKQLVYKSSGTDLTIDLSDRHVWLAGADDSNSGTRFLANIPTEEVFTAPLKTGLNGYVSSTKPLSYSGNLIEDFKITFENGKIVDFEAKKGEETLKNLIETDEGSHYIGEVALVPHNSPISNTETVFFNTLFDENASCHLAIGSAYPSCFEDFQNLSEEDFEKYEINQSLTHVDFMIGSDDLSVVGITDDGEKVDILKEGNWAI